MDPDLPLNQPDDDDFGPLFNQPDDPDPDPELGKRNRDDAMEQVEENAGELWNELAWRTLLAIIAHGGVGFVFTSELLRTHLREIEGGWPPPNDPRASGPVMTKARTRGYIEPNGTWSDSIYPSSNGMPKREWRVVAVPS